MPDFEIRQTAPSMDQDILGLYPRAFPEEDLTGLVADLLASGSERLSLGAVSGGRTLIGHCLFTMCKVADTDAALLGPLAVAPERQKTGIGSALVRAGLADLSRRGLGLVLVLGDPQYYGRLGFRAEVGVTAPYDLPDAWAPAWQSMRLDARVGSVTGLLQVPPAWQKRTYWAP